MDTLNVIRIILWIIALTLWLILAHEVKDYIDLLPIIGAVLTGLITYIAMQHIENQAAKRWTQEGYQKRKIELEIEIRKILLKFQEIVTQYPLKNLSDNGIAYNRAEIITKSDFKDSNIELLINELKIYDKKNKQQLELFIDIYKEFYTLQRPSRYDSKIGTVFEPPTEKFINVCNKFQNEVENVLKLFENIPQ